MHRHLNRKCNMIKLEPKQITPNDLCFSNIGTVFYGVSQTKNKRTEYRTLVTMGGDLVVYRSSIVRDNREIYVSFKEFCQWAVGIVHEIPDEEDKLNEKEETDE